MNYCSVVALFVYHRDYHDSTPMLIACQNGHDEIVQLLLDNEVEIKPDMLKTALEQHHE